VSDVYDAVVVGSGPAGGAAAIVLARAGCHTLLVDRHSFPRDKPCGDLIGARAFAVLRHLDLDLSACDDHPLLQGALLTAGGNTLDLTPHSRVGRRLLAGSEARVVPRFLFDNLLHDAARAAGAETLPATVRQVGPMGDIRPVRLDGETGPRQLAARTVIIAGGYGCRVARDIAPRERDDGPSRGIARRGYVRNVTAPPDRIVFALDPWLLPGYGWLFPLPDGRANVGVGMLAHPEDDHQARLDDLWQRVLAPESPLAPWLDGAEPEGRPRTWPLDLGPRQRRLVADGLLVAGEAAGLVGPLTGAGIANALESGVLAGATAASALANGDVSRHGLRSYGATIRRRYAPRLRSELWAQRFLADIDRTDALYRVLRRLPPTGVVGARLLLHLG